MYLAHLLQKTKPNINHIMRSPTMQTTISYIHSLDMEWGHFRQVHICHFQTSNGQLQCLSSLLMAWIIVEAKIAVAFLSWQLLAPPYPASKASTPLCYIHMHVCMILFKCSWSWSVAIDGFVYCTMCQNGTKNQGPWLYLFSYLLIV